MKCRRCKEEFNKKCSCGSLTGEVRVWNPFQLCSKCRRETNGGKLK